MRIPRSCTITPADVEDWKAACAAFYAARQDHEEFLDRVLKPAWQKPDVSPAEPSEGEPARSLIYQLERRGDALGELRLSSLLRLVKMPAADLEAFKLKFRLAYDEVLRFNDSEGLLAAMLSDLPRFQK